TKKTSFPLIIPDVIILYLSSLARKIEDIASIYNYNIIQANSDGDSKKEIKVLNTILAQQVDGIIFMGHQLSDEVAKEIELPETPVGLAGTIDEIGVLPSIVIDYKKAMKDSTQLLIDNGHENIALLSIDMESMKQKSSAESDKEAIENAGLNYDESFIIRTSPDLTVLDAADLVNRLTDLGITAATVEDDRIAISLLNELIEQGIKIPEDFEIVTSNNSPLVDLSRPKLTTVTQPLYDLGAVAMRLLTKLMNKEETDELHITLPYKLTE